jgi:hypothetical protein
MNNTSLQLTNATSQYVLKLLEGVQMKDRSIVWNQVYRDVRRASDIWSKIDKENKLFLEMNKNKSKPTSTNKI